MCGPQLLQSSDRNRNRNSNHNHNRNRNRNGIESLRQEGWNMQFLIFFKNVPPEIFSSKKCYGYGYGYGYVFP